MPVIEVEGLTRRFGKFTAVDDVSFAVESGEIFGFLGPNGAGKSTTINMLCTLLKPTAGRAAINGFDIATQQAAVRSSIGLIFQDPTLALLLSGWQNLQFHAMLYDVPKEIFAGRAKELLEMVDLTDKVHESVEKYSGGMKRRLEIALGLMHHPKVLFLDEPTIGLDPQTRCRIWKYLTSVREAEGLTIFLTTHYMAEAEICDRIAIIDHGKIIACESPDELKTMVGADVVTLRTADDERAAVILADRGIDAQQTGGGLRVETEHGDRFIPEAVRWLDEAGKSAAVTSAELKRPSLEEVFVKLTGYNIREEEASQADAMRAVARIHGGGMR